jgi:hypothetical protein
VLAFDAFRSPTFKVFPADLGQLLKITVHPFSHAVYSIFILGQTGFTGLPCFILHSAEGRLGLVAFIRKATKTLIQKILSILSN